METGSSARISLGRSTSAWAKPMRWRWPPLSSYGYLDSIASAGCRPTASITRTASARRAEAPSSPR